MSNVLFIKKKLELLIVVMVTAMDITSQLLIVEIALNAKIIG